MQSSRRHVARTILEEMWKEKFTGIQTLTRTLDGASIAASTNFIATCWESGGGGTVCVLDTKQVGDKKPQFNFFRGHTGPVQDIQFCPFYSSIFATASEDCSVKIWDCGNAWGCGDEPRQDAVATLRGHDKRVSVCAFNSAAEWIIASASIDSTVKIWDLEALEPVHSMSFDSHPVSIRWNNECNLIGVACKSREICVIDPRSDKVIGTPVLAHEGAKPVRLDWSAGPRGVGDNYIITTGFSRTAERQLRLWDLRMMKSTTNSEVSTPVSETFVDRGTSVLQPWFDVGTGLLMLYGKGNRNITFYGLESSEAPDGAFVKYGTFENTESWKDLAVAPKRAVEVMKCEILRCYGTLEGCVQPLSLCVPRRNMSEFQHELFPDCLSGEPALTAEQWLNGKTTRPLVTSMAPDASGKSPFDTEKVPKIDGIGLKRELTAVRGAASVLKKCLSTTKTTSESLAARLQQAEAMVEQQKLVIAERDRQIADRDRLLADRERKIQEKDDRIAKLSQSTINVPIMPPVYTGSLGISLASSANNMLPSELAERDRLVSDKLAELAQRTSLTERNIQELRDLIVHSKHKNSTAKYDVSNPNDVVSLLLSKIETLQRKYDKALSRNATLESVYASIRPVSAD